MFNRPKKNFIGSMSSSQKTEKRREARYPLEVEAIIFCGGEFFTTQTLNMSSSGIQLMEPLPEQFDGKQIEIQVASDMANPKKYQVFQASIVDSKRNRIHILKELFV